MPAMNAQAPSLRAWLVTALREVDGRSGTGWGPDLRAFDAAVDAVIEGADPAAQGADLSAPSAPRPARMEAVVHAAPLLATQTPSNAWGGSMAMVILNPLSGTAGDRNRIPRPHAGLARSALRA